MSYKIRQLILAIIHPIIFYIKYSCNGMLGVGEYSSIYKEVKKLPDYDVVEIGAAHGAISITSGKALKNSGKESNIIAIEKFSGGSRTKYGDKSNNEEIFDKNLAKFNIGNFVKKFPFSISILKKKKILNQISGDKISALIHDADGCIERDFYIFYPILIEDGLIVIDDYIDTKDYKSISKRYPLGGTKEQRIFRITNKLLDWNLMRVNKKIGSTLFCYKNSHKKFGKNKYNVCCNIRKNVMEEHKNTLNN